MSTLANGLYAWYEGFDNTDSTGSLDLVFQNGATTSTSGDNKCGSYFIFPQSPAVASYLQVSNATAPNLIPFESDQGFTFSTWAYNISSGSVEGYLLKLVSNHSPFTILTNGNIGFEQDCFGMIYHDSGYDLRSAMSANTWHHIAMVLKGDSTSNIIPTAKYYLDGTHVATITLSNNPTCNPIANNSNNGVGYIGNENTGGGYDKVFERMTDIAFWDRDLSDAEVSELASGCLSQIFAPGSARVNNISGELETIFNFKLDSSSIEPDYYLWSWNSVPPESSYVDWFNMTNVELYIPLDGNVIDLSGNGRDGTINSAYEVPGKVGSTAYGFNAFGGNITFGQNLLYTTEDFSFSLWVKPAAVQPNAYCSIFSAHKTGPGTGYYLIQNASNTNQYTFTGNPDGSYHPWSSTITLTADVWSHVAITRTGTNIKMYVNGVLAYDDPNDCAATIGYGTGNPLFTLGGADGNGAWSGSIDYFSSWSRVLSANEITNIYNLQSNPAAYENYNNIGSSFSFKPDVTGSYITQLAIADDVSTYATASVLYSSSKLVSDNYSLNYSINASRQRLKRVAQIPFTLSTKSFSSIRKNNDSDFEDS